MLTDVKQQIFHRCLAAAIAFTFLVLAVATARTKRPWGDEIFFANPAVNLITRGTMGLSVVEPTGNGQVPGIPLVHIQQHIYLVMPLNCLVQAAWFKAFGFSVLSMRAPAILFGLVALISWLVIVNVLTGKLMPALLAASLIAVDKAFIHSAADGRPDMMSAALSVAAVASYLGLRQRKLGIAIFASQALLAASIFTHPIGGIGIFAIIFLAVYFDRNRLRWRHLIFAALPYVVGAAAWGAYISLDPAAFKSQFFANMIGRFGAVSSPWSALNREIQLRYLENFYLPHYATGISRVRVIIPVVFAFAVFAGLFSTRIRAHEGYRTLLILVLTYFAVMTVFDGHKNSYYLVHITPLLSSCVAMWVYATWNQGSMRRWFAGGVLFMLLFVQVGWDVYSIRQNSYRSAYLPAVNYLRQHAAVNSLIFGNGELGVALGFYNNLVDDSTLGFYSGKRADFIVVDDKSYKESFKEYPAKIPELDRYITNLLTKDYRKVYSGPVYEIYERRL